MATATAAAAATASSMARPQLTFVTGNKNKLREVQQILAQHPAFPFEMINQDLDVPELQGTSQQVATAKCKAAAQLINSPVITEDTCLSFTALNGLPGPYIKHFLSSLGLDGLNTLLAGFEDKSATATTTFAYCSDASQEPILFEGHTRGKIVQPRGENRFGWDPIIEIDGTGKTYAEMSSEEKNKLSHRYKALELLREYLTNLK